MQKNNNKNLGVLLALSSSLFIAVEIIVVDYLYRVNPNIGALNMLFWSYLGVAISCSLIVPFLEKPIWHISTTIVQHKKLLIKDSILTVFAAFLFFLGIDLVGSGSVAVFSRASVIFSIILGVILLKEQLSLKKIFLIILMIIGFLLYQEDFEVVSLLGVLTILTSTFLYSLINYFIKKESRDNYLFYYSYLRQVLVLSLISFFLLFGFYPNLNFIGVSNFIILSLGCIFGGVLSYTTGMMAVTKIELQELL